LVSCYWAIHTSIQPYAVKIILDQVSRDASLSQVATPIAYYVLMMIVFTINARFYDYLNLNLYPKMKVNIIADAAHRISYYSYSFFQDQFAGGLTDKIKTLSKGAQALVQIFIERFFSHILALILAGITLMTVHPLLSLIFLIWTVLLLTVSLLVTQEARRLSHELSVSNSRVIGAIVDNMTNMLSVRLFAGNSHEEAMLSRKLNGTVSCDKNLRWFMLKMMASQEFATAIMIASSLLVLIFSVEFKQLTVGDFGLVLTLTLTFTDIIEQLSEKIPDFSEIYGMVSQGVALLNHADARLNSFGTQNLQITKGEIRFQKVHFSVPQCGTAF
jgi:ATP-binding cassette subfamily B protein